MAFYYRCAKKQGLTAKPFKSFSLAFATVTDLSNNTTNDNYILLHAHYLVAEGLLFRNGITAHAMLYLLSEQVRDSGEKCAVADLVITLLLRLLFLRSEHLLKSIGDIIGYNSTLML